VIRARRKQNFLLAFFFWVPVFDYSGWNPVTASPDAQALASLTIRLTRFPNQRYNGIRGFRSPEPSVIYYDLSGNVAASQAACDALPIFSSISSLWPVAV
jgi:hypothetical protein